MFDETKDRCHLCGNTNVDDLTTCITKEGTDDWVCKGECKGINPLHDIIIDW